MYQKAKKNLQKKHNTENALVGCGYWGTNIANTILKIKKKLIIYDSNSKNSKILNKRFKNQTYIKSFKQILQNKKIKNIFFATPPSQNFNLIKQALKFKKNIFVEKPGFKKISDFKRIQNLNKHNNIIMVGYIYCYNDYINFIKRLIKKKKLGKILYLNFQRQNLGPIRNDVNVKFDLASHDLSILIYFFSKYPKLVNKVEHTFLKKNISDISNLSFKIDGMSVDVSSSWLSPDKIRRITIISEKRMLLYDEMINEKKIKIFNKYAKYPQIDEFETSFFKKKAKIYEGKNFSPKIKEKEPLMNEIKYFLNCAKNKKQPITNLNFAMKIIEILKRV